LRPQQEIPPSSRSPQVSPLPALTWPKNPAGGVLSPDLLPPQQMIVLLVSSPQVWVWPAPN
jgi:hypothetical protein